MSIPRFALKPPLPPRLLEQVIYEIQHPLEREPIEVTREELENAPMRGAYECSRPTVHAELALKQGLSSMRWIDRNPNWRKARYKNKTIINLYEVTPFQHPDGGYWIYNWRLIIKGEAYERALVWFGQVIGEIFGWQ